MHIQLRVPIALRKPGDFKRKDSIKEEIPHEVVSTPGGNDAEFAFAHPEKNILELLLVCGLTKLLRDRLFHDSTPFHGAQDPSELVRNKFANCGCAETRNAQNKKDIRKTILLLALERAEYLVGRESKAIFRLKAHNAAPVAKQRPMERDVHPEEWPPCRVVRGYEVVRPQGRGVVEMSGI